MATQAAGGVVGGCSDAKRAVRQPLGTSKLMMCFSKLIAKGCNQGII